MDQPGVYQATNFELYTPSANVLPYAWCTFYLTADANVSIVDKAGHTEATIPLKAGYHPILVQKITAVSAGAVYIMGYNRLNS